MNGRRSRFLITAGPTRESIDAVRFISNRSSGRMGIELAGAAARAGHGVTLLLGPGPEPGPIAGCVIRFESASDLERLLDSHLRDCDVLLMAAAVGDFRLREVAAGKLPRRGGPDGGITLDLEPTPDLVAKAASARRPDQLVVAFALEESDRLESRAAEKLGRKRVDAIVANPLDTMDSPWISGVLLTADGRREAPGLLTKVDFADWLVGWVASALRAET